MQLPSFWMIFLALALPLPFGTDQPKRRVPWVTYALIGINFIVFVATFAPNTITPDYRAFMHWGLIPGALRPVTLVTSMFLHSSFSHLFWNMAFLWIFGPHVENAVGRVQFPALYVGGGVAGALLHVAIIHLTLANGPGMSEPMIGASGAVSSILAPYAMRFHRSNIQMIWLPGLILRHGWSHLEVPSVAGLGVWLLQNVAGAVMAVRFPESGEIAYWAHIGGFIFGFCAAELANLFQDGQQEYLLTDARGAAARGQDLLSISIQNYRGFLASDPDNASIRAELARTLFQHAGQFAGGGAADRAEAGREMTTAVRLFQNAGSIREALALYGEAGDLRLPLNLAARELLRLANSAQEAGELRSAETLFRTILTGMPEAPEAEMARLKLGQMLLKTDPAQSRSVLSGFLTRYPDSEWVRLVKELRAEAERLIAGEEV